MRTRREDKKTYVFSFMARCQRSSNCPMCWQPIRLKDRDRLIFILFFFLCMCLEKNNCPSVCGNHLWCYASQELLVAVEEERCFRSRPSRNAAMYHHPTIGGFHLQHVGLPTV